MNIKSLNVLYKSISAFYFFGLYLQIISPTHKRTKGRAPVWGSEFTSKDDALQGGDLQIAARLNVKLSVLVTGDW